MPSRLDLVTLNVAEPDRVAAFWSEALDLHETEREDGDRWVVLSSAEGVRRIGLQRGTPTRGSIHLDLACSPEDFDDEVTRLVRLGATTTRPPRVEDYGSIANLADPEGNLFDLCAYVSGQQTSRPAPTSCCT
jgi:predicted enzyme related to lactoylglutathione lyase